MLPLVVSTTPRLLILKENPKTLSRLSLFCLEDAKPQTFAVTFDVAIKFIYFLFTHQVTTTISAHPNKIVGATVHGAENS